MALLASENQVDILIKSKADASGIDQTTSSLHKLEGSSGLGSKALGGLAAASRLAATAMAAVGTGVSIAGGFALKSAASFEQTRIGLENMLGSADLARDLLSDISKFAAETPFEFPELAQATRQLVAFGFSGKDAFDTMKQLGDVSAAVGAPINDIAYLMGTLRTQGRAFTVDIRQFAQRGIPIYEYLAKVLNTNEQAISSMIEEGKIGFPEVQKAFQAMTGEGGKFHGTMAKQSKSLSGLFSTLKDNIGMTARELIGINQQGDVKEGSVFDRLRKAVAGLNDILPKAAAAVTVFFDSFMAGDNLSESAQLSKIGEAAEFLRIKFNQAVEAVKMAVDFLAPSFTALWATIQERLMPTLVRLWKEVLQPLAPIVGGVLVVAVKLFVDALNLLISAVSFGINLFVTFITWLKRINDAFVSTAAVVYVTLKPAFEAIGGFIINLINRFNSITQSVRNALRGVDEAIKAPFRDAFNWIDNNVSRITGALNRINSYSPMSLGSKAVKSIPGFASGGYTGQGAENQVAGVVHKGEYVVPKKHVDQKTGLPNIGGSTNNYHFHGNIVLDTKEAVNEFFKTLDNNSLLASKGLTPGGGM